MIVVCYYRNGSMAVKYGCMRVTQRDLFHVERATSYWIVPGTWTED